MYYDDYYDIENNEENQIIQDEEIFQQSEAEVLLEKEPNFIDEFNNLNTIRNMQRRK